MSNSIGSIIDMPFEDFKSELKNQKVNIGTINNLILYLEACYADLRNRKQGVIDLIFKEGRSKDDLEINKVLNGIYAEMVKIEQKVVYLKQERVRLINLEVN